MVAFEPYGPRTRGWRLAYACGAVALAGLFVAWIHSGWGGGRGTRTFVDLASTAAPLGAAALCFLRARRVPGERGLAWWLLGGACLSWGLGNVVWTWLELVVKVTPFPSWADAGYLGLLFFGGAALLAMVVGATAVTSRLRTLLDGLLIASAVLFAAWALVLRPIVAYAGSQESRLAQVLSLTYPIGDLVLVSLLVLLASRVPAPVRGTLAWLGAALVALAMADVGYAYLNAVGQYETGSPIDPGWLVGFLIIGYAALRPIPVLDPHAAPAPGILLSTLPLFPFLVSTAIAIGVQLREGWLEPFLFWNAIVVIALLTTRQFVMLLENIQLRREVERSLADLQRVQAARTQMLNNITHDLVSPLTPVRLQVRLIGTAHGPLTEKQGEALAIIRRNVEHVVSMVADLKDMSNLDSGKLRVDVQATDAAALVAQAVESMKAQAEERGIHLASDVRAPAPMRADPVRINQVLLNLVGNALKFTPSGGRVDVAVVVDGASVTFTVTDTGRGISTEDQARLFQPFIQVHDRARMAPGDRGTGLGLYICRGIVAQHGGTITVQSDGLGKGTRFIVRLPIP